MAYGDEVNLHCVERLARIDKSFAFLYRACRNRYIYFVCAEILAGQLKRSARAGTVFVKKRYKRFARKQIRLFDFARQKGAHIVGFV